MKQIKQTKPIVAIYTRVSTQEQATEGYSITEQEKIILSYCEKHEYTVYKCYSDKGISGKNINGRPALNMLLADALENKFTMVLSWKLNRLSRTLKDIMIILDTFESNGIQYKSLTENFETETPAGKMMLQLFGAVGEMERNTIAENVKMGLSARAREGKWCGGAAPFGYNVEHTHNGKRRDSYLVVNEKEAEIVRYIFKKHCTGWGYKKITNDLNTKGYKTKKGKPFAISTVREILRNPVYAGYIRYNYHQNWSQKRRKGLNPNPIIAEGIHQAIIDRETWEKSKIIMQKKTKADKKHNGFYPLTGLLRCPECGRGMVLGGSTQKKGRVFYYICGGFHSHGSSVCHSNGIRCDVANDIVLDKIVAILNNEKLVEKVVEKMIYESKNSISPLKEQIEKVKRDCEKLNNSKEKLFELYELEIITKEEFLERKQTIEHQKSIKLDLLKELEDELIGKENVYSVELVKEVLSRFKKVLLNSNESEQVKLLLQMLIKEIKVKSNKEIESVKLIVHDEIINYLYDSKEDMPEGVSSFFLGKHCIEIVI